MPVVGRTDGGVSELLEYAVVGHLKFCFPNGLCNMIFIGGQL